MEFVNFELAKKLKDLGYNVPFFFFYRTDDQLIHHAAVGQPLVYGKYVDNEVVIAPTISQVLKWLSDEKEVDLVIEPIYFFDENRRREYGVRVFAPWWNKPMHCGYFNTREEAALMGIEYALNNLI